MEPGSVTLTILPVYRDVEIGHNDQTPCRLVNGGRRPDDNPIYDADPVQVYVTEVGRIPALDRSEEMACIEHADLATRWSKPPGSA